VRFRRVMHSLQWGRQERELGYSDDSRFAKNGLRRRGRLEGFEHGAFRSRSGRAVLF
jgi:hypothetical protein